jgi:hypothetical protein
MPTQLLTETPTEPTLAASATTPVEIATEATQSMPHTRAVHEWFAKIRNKAHRDKMVFWGLFISCQMFLFVPIALGNTIATVRSGHLNPLWIAMLCLPSFGMAAVALRFMLRKPDWSAEEMTRIGGVQAVGPLLELLGSPKGPRQLKPLFVALIQLLPRMKASDSGLLTAGQRKLLYTLLKGGLNVYAKPDLLLQYRLAVLKALEQIGDADAIPIVEHLATAKARTTDQKALKAAAIECLPSLLMNCSDVEDTKTLLRASSPETAAPEMLLRAVEFTPDSHPKQLLQAADPPASARDRYEPRP